MNNPAVLPSFLSSMASLNLEQGSYTGHEIKVISNKPFNTLQQEFPSPIAKFRPSIEHHRM